MATRFDPRLAAAREGGAAALRNWSSTSLFEDGAIARLARSWGFDPATARELIDQEKRRRA